MGRGCTRAGWWWSRGMRWWRLGWCITIRDDVGMGAKWAFGWFWAGLVECNSSLWPTVPVCVPMLWNGVFDPVCPVLSCYDRLFYGNRRTATTFTLDPLTAVIALCERGTGFDVAAAFLDCDALQHELYFRPKHLLDSLVIWSVGWRLLLVNLLKELYYFSWWERVCPYFCLVYKFAASSVLVSVRLGSLKDFLFRLTARLGSI